jgi:hypothetical protein
MPTVPGEMPNRRWPRWERCCCYTAATRKAYRQNGLAFANLA